MSTLTDRYVFAVTRSLPADQRVDHEMELRASIDDAIEARVGSGGDRAAAERDVLLEMGDPDRMAATYADRSRFLIGPALYRQYIRLLGVLLGVVVPIFATVIVLTGLASDARAGEVITETLGGAATVAIQIAFWLTVTFAVLEWSGARVDLIPWNLDRLPERPEHRIGFRETIGSIAGLVVFAAFLVWQQVAPFFRVPDGDRLPALDPDLWSFWGPALLVLIAASAGFEWVKYRIGRWTWPLAVVNALLGLATGVSLGWLALRGDLINPELADRFGWHTADDANSAIGLVIALVIGAVAVWVIADGVIRTWRVERGNPLAPWQRTPVATLIG